MLCDTEIRRRPAAAPPEPTAGLRFLYRTAAGRAVLKLLTRRGVSRAVGAYMNSRLSKPRIKRFIRKNGIDMSCCEKSRFDSFNDFFTRRLKEGSRPVDLSPAALVSPCDAKVSAYRVGDGAFTVKGAPYTVDELLNGDPIAERFRDGICLVFRLAVDDYHRYCCFDGGEKGENIFIPGVLHTVQPIAFDYARVFHRNCREYSVFRTDRFGTAVQVEVGAMCVGRIKNFIGAGRVERGQELGTFEFGGSTVILLLGGDAAEVDAEFFENTAAGLETKVRLGERIGSALL